MGKYWRLLRLDHSELKHQNSEALLLRFFPEDKTGQEFIDMDKSMEGIFFLLTGRAFSPASTSPYNIFFGATLFMPADSGQDEGYRELSPCQVKELNNLLACEEFSIIRNNYDPLVMMAAGVYPDIWAYGNEAYDFLLMHLLGLMEFISKAAAQSQAVLLLIS